MTVACALCENAIQTGERREIRDAETVHYYCARKEDARESYQFYIQNPAENPAVGLGFWYRQPGSDREYPILENTGGLTVYVSAESEYGDSLPVKREFIEAFGLGWHWLMCYQPTASRLPGEIERIFDDYYDGVAGTHERWALSHLLTHALLSPGPLPHEWKPLIDFADACTAIGVPEVRDG